MLMCAQQTTDPEKTGDTWRSKLKYATKFIFVVGVFEISLHYIYSEGMFQILLGCMSDYHRGCSVRDNLSHFQIFGLAWWHLLFTWLKLWAVWRLARALSRFDGVDPPEVSRAHSATRA